MYRRTNTITRLFIFLPVAVLGLLSPGDATAEIDNGINVTVYNNFGYNGSPPLPDISGRPIVGTTEFQNINQNFDQSPPFGMYEDFIVKYEGHITSPVTGSIAFWPHADDGTMFYLEGVLIDEGNWVDKGGGGNQSDPQEFIAGVSRPFTYWYYENGGGANTALYWDIGNGWEIVPASAFTQQPSIPTTTTIAPFLNNPQNLIVTSTNETKVYLSWDTPEQSNTDVERYAIFWSCDNWSSGFAISSFETFAVVENLNPDEECLFKVRADNDTLSVYSEWSNEISGMTLPTTTTSTTSTTTTTTSTTSTTTTTTTIVQEEIPLWTTTTVLTPPAIVTTTSTTTTTERPVGTTTSTIPVQTTVLQQTEQPQTTTTTLAPKIEENISSDEATQIATNPEVIASLNAEDAAKVFAAIDINEITPEQAAQIIEAVQEAPQEVREAFEEEVNVFGGKVDTYVPLDSTIPVGQRRVIIAIAAITAAIPVAPTRR